MLLCVFIAASSPSIKLTRWMGSSGMRDKMQWCPFVCGFYSRLYYLLRYSPHHASAVVLKVTQVTSMLKTKTWFLIPMIIAKTVTRSIVDKMHLIELVNYCLSFFTTVVLFILP